MPKRRRVTFSKETAGFKSSLKKTITACGHSVQPGLPSLSLPFIHVWPLPQRPTPPRALLSWLTLYGDFPPPDVSWRPPLAVMCPLPPTRWPHTPGPLSGPSPVGAHVPSACRPTSNSVRQKLTLAETANSPPLPVFYLLLFTPKCQISVFFFNLQKSLTEQFLPRMTGWYFCKSSPPKCTVTHYRWVSLSFSQQFNSVISCL